MHDGPLLTNALIILCAPEPVIAGEHPAYALGPGHLDPVQVPVVAQLRLGLAHLQHRITCSVTRLEQHLCNCFSSPVTCTLSGNQSLPSSVWVWLTGSTDPMLQSLGFRSSMRAILEHNSPRLFQGSMASSRHIRSICRPLSETKFPLRRPGSGEVLHSGTDRIPAAQRCCAGFPEGPQLPAHSCACCLGQIRIPHPHLLRPKLPPRIAPCFPPP